jgi:hypothetical protein
MGWRVFGERLDTADFSGTPRVYQPVKFAKSYLLKAIRTWVIFYNDPAVTSLKLEIWSNQSGTPGTPKTLLFTSNALTKATMITSANGVKEVYFDFTTLPELRAGDWYHFCLRGSGYTGDSTTHVAWKRAWPDPANTTNLTTTYVSLGVSPFDLTFIGGKFA